MTDVDPKNAGEPAEDDLPPKPPVEVPEGAEDLDVDPEEVEDDAYLSPEEARNDETVDDAEDDAAPAAS